MSTIYNIIDNGVRWVTDKLKIIVCTVSNYCYQLKVSSCIQNGQYNYCWVNNEKDEKFVDKIIGHSF